MKKFSYKIDDLELRSCNNHLLSKGKHERAEIVKWFEPESCYTVAYWKKNSDKKFDLVFVGDEFLKENKNIIWSLIEIGQKRLDKVKSRDFR